MRDLSKQAFFPDVYTEKSKGAKSLWRQVRGPAGEATTFFIDKKVSESLLWVNM